MSNPGSNFNYFAWPTAAKLRDGRFAVGASGYRLDHICPFGKAVIQFSSDEGESYTYPAPIIDTYLDDRDVGLCPFGESGLIVTTFNNTLYKSVSYDGGKTWTAPEQILPDRGGAPAHLMRHSSGVIIASFGFRDKPFGIKVMLNADGGKSFDEPEYVYNVEYVKPSWDEYTRGCDIGYASTVELNDGSLITVFYAYPNADGHVIMQQHWRFKE